jgi:hypothetical protein
MKLPVFPALRANYPTDLDGYKVKNEIGGEVTQAWLGDNTCVIRMSKAFNYAGTAHEIPKRADLLTVKGADKKNYAVRVAQFVAYLLDKYGAPDITKTGTGIAASAFAGKVGLIVWHIDGWNDATGHFTLWDGNNGLYEGTHDYFTDFPTTKPPLSQPWLTKVELWQC